MKLKEWFIAIFFILTSLINFPLDCWSSAGHRVVAEIAHSQLSKDTKEWVDTITNHFGKQLEQEMDFLELSTWMDKVRAQSALFAFDRWHYTDLVYDPNMILSNQEKELIHANYRKNDVIWAIETACKTLASPKATLFEQTLMLALLVHCTADIHQPLHVCSRYSLQLPKGDFGGNLFYIKEDKIKTLHKLWDQAFGILPDHDVSLKHWKSTKNFSKILLEEYPLNYFVDLQKNNPKAWALESYHIATDFAYSLKPNTKLTASYVKQGKKICTERLAIAGYRLKCLLEHLYQERHH